MIKASFENLQAFDKIITNNKEMLSIFQYIMSIAPSSQTVLITGETGVGKELIAKSIHTFSKLKGQFVSVNVAGLEDNVFSDTLFGHIKGAFTGADRARRGLIELAADGTLFLDEIGDLSTASQVKLLRLLQENEYLPLGQDEIEQADVRIVVSTNGNLWSLQRNGKFRKDLNYRIRTHHIHILPLRERIDDIPLLVDHFLGKSAFALKKKKPTPPKELFPLLGVYSFPGNVRELEAMIHDAVSLHTTKVLSLEVFKLHIKRGQGSLKPLERDESKLDYPISFGVKLPNIRQATQLLVAEAMKRANGNQTLAADMLGISRQALNKRIKSENLELAQK